ncbi:uncharacterized protein LOC120445332 isoform X1 [Drosophila santomea]|uniref:uncharacterized protein LOC120445332 isoform X1 n=1 Tax=Drosophila santomea TaxID=129105 RepID=UPI0019548A1C|nr:uncharacterized protein LOC120445332 isoform X1 [Drosophila santomea]
MLKKCCFCVKLRKACIIIAIVDFLFNVVVLNLAGHEFIAHIEQAVAICHCIGCTFLLGGALIRSTVLLMFFLITSLTNCMILLVYCIYMLIKEERYREIIVPGSAIYICCGIYFWIVVYSYYAEVRNPEEVVEV